jgi:hypothetical protein
MISHVFLFPLLSYSFSLRVLILPHRTILTPLSSVRMILGRSPPSVFEYGLSHSLSLSLSLSPSLSLTHSLALSLSLSHSSSLFHVSLSPSDQSLTRQSESMASIVVPQTLPENSPTFSLDEAKQIITSLRQEISTVLTHE